MADREFKESIVEGGSFHRDISSYIDTGGGSDIIVDAFDSLIDSDSEAEGEAISTTRISIVWPNVLCCFNDNLTKFFL